MCPCVTSASTLVLVMLTFFHFVCVPVCMWKCIMYLYMCFCTWVVYVYMCMYVYLYVCMYAYVCVHVCSEAKGGHKMPCSHRLPCSTECFSPNLELAVVQRGQQASHPQQSSVTACPTYVLQAQVTKPGFYMHSGDLNPGPYSSAASPHIH